MSTTASGQANQGQASRTSSKRAVPGSPGVTEATRQAHNEQHWEDKKSAEQTAQNTEADKNTTTSDQASNVQAFLASRKWIAVPMPPGMTEEIRQANIRQYLEERKLADETAKNTEFNKKITISDQARDDQASPRSRKGKKVSISPGMMEEAR
jgi:hypothetical protein